MERKAYGKDLRKPEFKTRRDIAIIEYKKKLTEHNKMRAKYKKLSWGKFCEEIKSESEFNRWKKTMSKTNSKEIGSLRKENGRYTDSPLEICGVLKEQNK